MTRATLGGMFPARAKELGYLETLGKFAASRLDKEVAAGRARYEDVLPATALSPGMTPEEVKKLSRTYSHTPAAPPDLARHRELNQRLFNAQLARPGALVRADVTGSAPLSFEPRTYAFAERTPGVRHDSFDVEVSPRSGRYLRMMAEKRDANIAQNALARAPSRLPPSHPMDATLNLSALQHELGEVEAMTSRHSYPHASHAGIEPTLRELMAVRADPEAYGVTDAVTHMYAGTGVPDDDILFAKLHKQVGGTGNAPVQPGTRRARALEKRLVANAGQLMPATRREHILDQLNELSDVAGTGIPAKRIGFVPDELYDALAKAQIPAATPLNMRGKVFNMPRQRLRLKDPALNALARRYIATGRL